MVLIKLDYYSLFFERYLIVLRFLKNLIVLFSITFQYPLLLESLLSYTDERRQPEEYEQISRSLERSKEILAYVNTKIQEADSSYRLSDIQRRLDQSALAKNKTGCEELRGVN